MPDLNRFFLCTISFNVLFALSGCSISESSNSSMTSFESISKSSTAALPSDNSKYQSAIADYTYAYLKQTTTPTAKDFDAFQTGLGTIAKNKGMTDWEANLHTYKAIGKALKKEGSVGESYQNYRNSFAQADPIKMQAIQDGYESVN